MKRLNELRKKELDTRFKTKAFLAKAYNVMQVKSLHAQVQALDAAMRINQYLLSNASLRS